MIYLGLVNLFKYLTRSQSDEELTHSLVNIALIYQFIAYLSTSLQSASPHFLPSSLWKIKHQKSHPFTGEDQVKS